MRPPTKRALTGIQKQPINGTFGVFNSKDTSPKKSSPLKKCTNARKPTKRAPSLDHSDHLQEFYSPQKDDDEPVGIAIAFREMDAQTPEVSPDASLHDYQFSPSEFDDVFSEIDYLSSDMGPNYDNGQAITVEPNLFNKLGKSMLESEGSSEGSLEGSLVFHEKYGVCRVDQFPEGQVVPIPFHMFDDTEKSFEEQKLEFNGRSGRRRRLHRKYGQCKKLPTPGYIDELSSETAQFHFLNFRKSRAPKG